MQYRKFIKSIDKVFNLSIITLNKATHDGKHSASGGVAGSKKMLMAYWDKLIDGIDEKIETTKEPETKEILKELKKEIKDGKYGYFENGYKD